ncbi:hypothetical protein FS749_001140 [Ceratobasidium sp. UAMH 11750]|nr:hypothetical protein FS749_001140 [Ceratobasidium sp. UAMH 11750]
MPRTQTTPAPAEDSLNLKLDITVSRLLVADFGELGDMSNDFGESVMTGSKGSVGLLETHTLADACSTNNDTEDTSVDSILDATRGEQAESY